MNTKLLNDDILAQVQDAFSHLKEPVEVVFFGSQEDCELCEDTLQLVKEVTDISDKLSLSIYDIDENRELADTYNLDKVPGLVLVGRDNGEVRDYGIRFAGIPSGHEFSSLIHDLVLVSGRDSGLSDQTRKFLSELTEPVLLQVFVTPTCPYCPSAVVTAHQMALESPLVQAEMVEATEFQELSMKHKVSGVPQTTINSGKGHAVGALPEGNLVAEIQRALN
jgi:glutaredoxin-like protein